eukprot:CCRYP_015359-RA/>CCRYP_015359-RA protein AED:0.06 eAED:0.06 QI:124/0.83/1/1/0.66/0.71/7/2939/507
MVSNGNGDNLGSSTATQCCGPPALDASTTAPNTDNNVENDDSNENSSEATPPPLYQSPRLKGYITMLSASIYNFISASDRTFSFEEETVDWCLAQYDLGKLGDDPRQNLTGLRYAKAAAMITSLVTGAVILIHFVSITGLGNKLWSRMFGKHGNFELYISSFLTILWIITTWFNTTIRGPAGNGKEQYNLYFSTWICCFTSFWILESWSTSSGRASCPMWIVTFILAFTDFCFVLDTSKNWKEGVAGYPYIYKYFSSVKSGEWTLLLFLAAITSICSLAWILVEIFRENKMNRYNMKSDQENHVEGLVIQILTVIWVLTVFIVTVPGGAASLLGNLYFTTWSCSFSVVGTLIWWQRNWREGIFAMIEDQQNEYSSAKRQIRRREEKRLAALRNENTAQVDEFDEDEELWMGTTHQYEREADGTETIEDEEIAPDSPNDTEEDHVIAEEDDNTTEYTIRSTEHRPRLGSVSSSVTTISPSSGALCSSRSLFVSALSVLPSREEDQRNE